MLLEPTLNRAGGEGSEGVLQKIRGWFADISDHLFCGYVFGQVAAPIAAHQYLATRFMLALKNQGGDSLFASNASGK